MNRWNHLFLIAIIMQTSCATSNETYIKRLDGTIIEENQLDENVQFLMQEANVTGLALCIFSEDTVVYQKAFGYSNFETKDSLDVNHILGLFCYENP